MKKVSAMDEDRIKALEEKRVPCEVYSRVVGYIRPVSQWNEGKQEEFADRHVYSSPAKCEADKK